MSRAREDGSEMVSAVMLIPVLVLFLFGFASLCVGAFQRQLVEYGVAHIADALDPSMAELGTRDKDTAVRAAILRAVPLLERTADRLHVSGAHVELVRTRMNSRMLGSDYAREADPWRGKANGHVDAQQVHVVATVSYDVPPLFQSLGWHRGENDVFVIQLDRTFVVSRREEVC